MSESRRPAQYRRVAGGGKGRRGGGRRGDPTGITTLGIANNLPTTRVNPTPSRWPNQICPVLWPVMPAMSAVLLICYVLEFEIEWFPPT